MLRSSAVHDVCNWLRMSRLSHAVSLKINLHTLFTEGSSCVRKCYHLQWRRMGGTRKGLTVWRTKTGKNLFPLNFSGSLHSYFTIQYVFTLIFYNTSRLYTHVLQYNTSFLIYRFSWKKQLEFRNRERENTRNKKKLSKRIGRKKRERIESKRRTEINKGFEFLSVWL